MKVMLNDKEYELTPEQEEMSILEFATIQGDDIPSLCFLKEAGNNGKCGVCKVEVEKAGTGKVKTTLACRMKMEDGMSIHTNTEKTLEAAKKAVVRILNKHDFRCGKCVRKENCELLALSSKLRVRPEVKYSDICDDLEANIDRRSMGITIDRNKCILCGRCEAMCKVKTSTGSIKLQKIDGERKIAPLENVCFDDTNCVLCGQCVNACPVGALQETSELDRVEAALDDPDKHVLVAIAPSIRTSFGELEGEEFGVDTMKKVYAGLRAAGFDRIYDINFGADMTIMEEATELKDRLLNGGVLPMFTSCCPGWVRLLHNYHPECLDHFSSAKSPQQMFGAASKSYYPAQAGIDPSTVYTVTVMPCLAKKMEAHIPSMEVDGQRDIDAVITTRELAKLFKARKVKWRKLEEEEPDQPMSEFTGDGTGFGFSGGVMQAALRTAKHMVDGGDLDIQAIQWKDSGIPGVKEFTAELGDLKARIGVVDGAVHAFDLFESGQLNDFAFVEVMACEGGCINGGGQPHVNAHTRLTTDFVAKRRSVLKNEQKESGFSKSYENKTLQVYYNDYIGEPASHKAHKYLHYDFQTNYDNNEGWRSEAGKEFSEAHQK